MKEQRQVVKKQQNWKSVTVRLKEDELAILNGKLKINGFDNFSQFVHAWIKGDYPVHENNEQVERLLNRIRDKGIVDPLTGEFNPIFYRNINSEDMLKDLSKRYVYPKHAKDLNDMICKNRIKFSGNTNITNLVDDECICKSLSHACLGITNSKYKIYRITFIRSCPENIS